MLPGFARYMMPLCTIGVVWFAPALSFIAHTQASCRSFTLARVISVERAVAPALIVAPRHQPVARRRILQHRRR